jgi:YidC/Oxa1 family membrane protein insertase
LPLNHLWVVVIENPLSSFLLFLFNTFQAVPILSSIGAYGVAIIVLTVIIRLALSPLTQFQLVTQRKTMAEQRKLAPQVAEIRKKFKKDTARINSEMMKLYQEHGVNPLGGMIGCLPLVVQTPVLIALYYVFRKFATSGVPPQPFLFVPNLNEIPSQHFLFHLNLLVYNVAVPTPEYIIFPLLAAATTFVQSKMLQQPRPLNPTEQELQTQQMQRTMVWLSPVMIAVFALQVPAGLGMYWFVGNCVSIIQQYFVVGWGNLFPKRGGSGPSPAVVPSKGGGGSPGGPRPSLKPAPQNGRPRRRKR